GVGCRGAGGGPGHFVLAGSEAAQPESAGRVGHWFGGLFRLLPRGLRLPDRVDPERRGGVDGSAILDPHGGDGHFLPAAGHGRVLWARLLRWCLRARRDSGVGAAEAGPGAAAVGPRAGPAEVRLSRAGALFRPEAGGRARLRDLPVRSVRGLLSPERRPPHAPDRRRFSGSGHVHRTAVLPLSVSLRRTARVVHALGPPRSNHHAGQGTGLRPVHGSLPLWRDREDAGRAPQLSVLRPVLCIVPPRRRAGASQGAVSDVVRGASEIMTARTWTWIAGAAVVACVAILLADYALATWRAPRDDKLIKNLQQQGKADPALAPELSAEQKRITAARRARKSRDNAVTWILIGAACVFLTFARQVVETARPNIETVGQASWPARDFQSRFLASDARLAPTVDLTFIDDLVAKEGRSKEGAIVLLQAIQKHYRYLPDEAIRRLCELTEITPAQFAGTSSFYGQFRRTPAGKHTVRVCHGTACHVAGARQVTDELRRYLAIPDGADTDPARMFTVDEVACVGCCSLAPVLMLDGRTAGRLTPSSASAVLSHLEVTAEETQTA